MQRESILLVLKATFSVLFLLFRWPIRIFNLVQFHFQLSPARQNLNYCNFQRSWQKKRYFSAPFSNFRLRKFNNTDGSQRNVETKLKSIETLRHQCHTKALTDHIDYITLVAVGLIFTKIAIELKNFKIS